MHRPGAPARDLVCPNVRCAGASLTSPVQRFTRALMTNIAVLVPAFGFIFIGWALVWVWTKSKYK